MTPWQPIETPSNLPAQGAEESEWIDFKVAPWANTESESIELARDVAQFANHLGGTILVGADEHDDHLIGFVDVADRAALERRIVDTCYARLSPRVQVNCVMITAPSGAAVVAINVQPSSTPIGVRVKHGRWDFFRRHGKGKKPMEFEEVEQMWSDGRRGRLLLSRIPEQEFVYLDAAQIDSGLSRALCRVRCCETHFEVTMPNSRFINLPYEFVKAVCPRAGGGWYLALAVRFFHDASTMSWGFSHVF